MKLEHKIGIAITCTFLCLSGAVVGLKMHEQESAETPRVASSNTPSAEEKPAQSHGQKVKEDDDTKSSKKHSSTEKPPITPEPSRSPLPPDPSSPSAAVSKHSSSGDNKLTPPFSPFTAAHSSKEEKKKSALPGGDSHKKSSLAPNDSLNIRKVRGSLGNTTPPGPVEPQPIALPVDGANEWGKTPAGGGNAKKQPKPDSMTKPAGPTSAASSASKAKEPTATMPPPAAITPVGAHDAMPLGPLPLPTGPSTPPSPGRTAASAPLGSGNPPAPAPSTANNSGSFGNPVPPPANGNGVTQSLPPYMSLGKPANSVKPAGLPVKENITTFPSPDLDKPGTMPPPAATPAPPLSPSVAPSSTPSASPPSPAGLGVPTPASGSGTTIAPPINPPPPPSLSPAPPAAPPAPAPVVTPLTPPKPPVNGSDYIEDPLSPPSPGSAGSSTAPSGRLGAIPAPLPLTPPSSPLASGGIRTPPGPKPASTGASVKVFDEIEYVCKPNDTYESISKKYFMGSPNYAKALQRHNQNHARASELMQKSGALKPGEKIYVPQAYILEERYADAIDKPGKTIVPASGTGAPPNP